MIYDKYVSKEEFALLSTGAGSTLSSSDIFCEYAGDVAIAHKIAG